MLDEYSHLEVCPICSGIGVLVARGNISCTRCKGAGKIAKPAPARRPIVIVGEAWGEEEARLGMPFVGASGRELDRMLEEAELSRGDCYLTNVFNLRPQPTNDINNLGTIKTLSQVPMPEMTRGVYLQNQYFPEVERLWEELRQWRPNLVLALGNTALWALTGQYGIKALRGTVTESIYGVPGLKVLPTYHPSAVLRDWSMRSVVIADLMKAKRQSKFPEIRRPSRELWLEPTIRDLEFFYEKYVVGAKILSADIETTGKDYSQITCVGFATSADQAICIPFVDNRKPTGSYWPTAHQEKLAWGWVKKYLEHSDNPETEILGQNFLYATNWLWTKAGMVPKNFARDTMLKHHALNPELEKGLGFLGSIYTDEPAWKIMRGAPKSTKRGE